MVEEWVGCEWKDRVGHGLKYGGCLGWLLFGNSNLGGDRIHIYCGLW